MPPYGDGLTRQVPLERLRQKIDAFAEQPEGLQQEPQETMFHHLIAPQPQTGREGIRSKAVLWQEANNMVAAGSETTASILTIATFYILNDPTICVRLVQELVEAWPDVEMQVSLATLERLPYLVRARVIVFRTSPSCPEALN